MEWMNYPLLAAILGILIAQGLKVPIYFVKQRKVQGDLVFSTGGMPSSHSASVTALATAIGVQEGFTSSIFALATIFAVITMFDASGVRRQAGEHSIVINQLLEFVHGLTDKSHTVQTEKLREMLGHKPAEVFVGGILGVVIAYVLSLLI